MKGCKILPESSTSKKHHSPHKKSNVESSPLFPPECIFCEQKTKKIRNKKYHKLSTFISYKDTDMQWEHIEAQAQELENN